jgi:hypothetical protein
MGLVLEMQQAAMDSDTDIPALLRKAHVVAHKLKLRAFKAWTECEMNGYDAGKKLPPYRRVYGNLVCYNPYNGLWIPLTVSDARSRENLSLRELHFSVKVLQEQLKSGQSLVRLPYPPILEASIMGQMREDYKPATEISLDAHQMILDTVRNTILKWSLKLEDEGIFGEGLTFKQAEVEVAAKKQDELRPVIHINIENMTNSVLQAGSPGAEVYFDPSETENN